MPLKDLGHAQHPTAYRMASSEHHESSRHQGNTMKTSVLEHWRHMMR